MGALSDPDDIPFAPRPLCDICRHTMAGQKCKAFSGELPVEISTLRFDHRYPHPLDNGLRFEFDPECQRVKHSPIYYLIWDNGVLCWTWNKRYAGENPLTAIPD